MNRFVFPLVILAIIQIHVAASQEPVLYDVPVNEEEGITLKTDVYFPPAVPGPWPVVLGRTPYGRDSESGSIMLPESARKAMTDLGIVAVIQDVRGRNGSGGEEIAFVADGWGEEQDGLDTVNWILAQEWCNGKIATIGASAGGVTQILLAGTGPQGITGQMINYAPISNYHSFAYIGGVFRTEMVEGWLVSSMWPIQDNLLPIRSHPTYDSYWQTQNLEERADRVNWPVVVASGWYDLFLSGSINLYKQIRTKGGSIARENVHLVIGPYHHTAFNTLEQGELTFPENALMPYGTLWPTEASFTKHWLLNEPLDPVPPRVLYYTMGEISDNPDTPGNEWRQAADWPPPASQRSLYLTQTNTLLSLKPSTPEVLQYTYDPDDPVLTRGGQNFMLTPGPYDQQQIETRNDVLLFSSEVLESPLEITGPVTAVLYVSTDGNDTDFTAKLTDVYPDGRSMLIADGIRKLSMRGDLTQTQNVVPGQTYQIEIEVGETSIVINRGHRIRLAVSSSNSPRFEPNPNTGNSWLSRDKKVAEQSVYVGGDQASHLILPIVENQTEVQHWPAHR